MLSDCCSLMGLTRKKIAPQYGITKLPQKLCHCVAKMLLPQKVNFEPLNVNCSFRLLSFKKKKAFCFDCIWLRFVFVFVNYNNLAWNLHRHTTRTDEEITYSWLLSLFEVNCRDSSQQRVENVACRGVGSSIPQVVPWPFFWLSTSRSSGLEYYLCY